MSATSCGLFLREGPAPVAGPVQIPLLGVRIDARLEGVSTRVTHVQRYRNEESSPVEAVYVFPLEEGAAVCGFAARIGEREVRGRVEERDEAFEVYDDAMADGHGAFLLDQERPNVFTASVGNLKPGEEVAIEISYVALARYEGDAVRLMIPTTVSPRYVPADTPPQVGEPDGERVNPERWFEVPYGLRLKVKVEGAVRSLDSPSHPVRVHLGEKGATVELAREEAALDRDFVLLVEPEEPDRSFVRLAREDDGAHVAMVSFYPESAPEREREEPGEIFFLLDCSGSMGGDSIEQAKRALLLSIRALGEGDSFNVVRFGSRHESLWSSPRAFGEETLAEATRHVERIRADLGGTEILRPLQELLEAPGDPERRRQVLLLTDGQVSNEGAVIQVAEKHASRVRIFTFGLGAGASEHLVREVARVSQGAAELIFPGERIEAKVLRMFGRVRLPRHRVRVSWGGLRVDQAPAVVPAVFAGESVTLFGRFQDPPAGEVTLKVGDEAWTLPLRGEDAVEGSLVPTLWARHRIRDLETGLSVRPGSGQERGSKERRRREELVEIGRRYGLLTSATSYVAVEERPEAERTDTPAELRKIPIALTTGWGGLGGRGAVSLGAPRKARRPFATAALRVQCLAKPAEQHFASAAVVPIAASPPEALESSFEMGFGGAPAPASQDSDRLYDLLMTQWADGSFLLSPVLEDWLGTALTGVREAAGQHGEALVVTAAVLAILERDEAAREDEWRPAARKARLFLERQGGFDASALLAPRAKAS